jgi:dTDP-glucose 4,6-dehydratase
VPSLKILVTGGAGFIGSAVVRQYIRTTRHTVVDLDKLTYAASLDALEEARDDPRHVFVRADVCDAHAVRAVFAEHRPDAVMHLAAETHVDRSIDDPRPFVDANVTGTLVLLEAARAHWRALDGEAQARFRFLQVSTDEVYGSLAPGERADEAAPAQPNSPYAASKAAGEQLVRAWHRTYGLPAMITAGCNTFGPYQFPDKLVPHVILTASAGQPIPVYGEGRNARDWLHVEDHARALRLVLERGTPGARYNIGAGNERANLALVETLCGLLDARRPDAPHLPHRDLIEFVADRPGHDQRYAVDAGKIGRELGWTPRVTFADGMAATVEWYLAHGDWCGATALAYDGRRLGLGAGTAAG